VHFHSNDHVVFIVAPCHPILCPSIVYFLYSDSMIKKNRAYFHFFILVKDVELNFWTVQSVDGVLEKQGKKKKKKMTLKKCWKKREIAFSRIFK
jgi:hypothetical protein